MGRVKRRIVRIVAEKKEVVQKAGGWAYSLTEPGKEFMFELTQAEEGETFCCFDGDSFFRLDTIEQADHIIVPPAEDKVTWRLPRLIEGKGNPPDAHPLFTKMVWDEVRGFIRDHLDLPEQQFEVFLTAWVFATWFQDIPLSASPYPFFIGLKRAGKTRSLEVLKELCFRAKALVGISGAAIRTNIRLLRPTLLIDEADLQEEEKWGEIVPLLLAYRPDMYVERKDPKAKGFDQLVVDEAFCYKAIASRKPLGVNIMDRCIEIKMRPRRKPIKRLFTSDSLSRAERIRTQLLEVRMRCYDLVEAAERRAEPIGLRDDRVDELFSPLHRIAKLFGASEDAETIKALAEQTVLTFEKERAMTDEHDVVEAMCKLKDDGKVDASNLLPTTSLLEKLNEGRSESAQLSAKKLAAILRRLGFERVQARYQLAEGKNLRCVVVKPDLLEFYREEFKIGQEQAEGEPTGLTLGEKMRLVYDKVRKLAEDRVVSKLDVADALEGRLDRGEVFQLLEKLGEEGKLAKRDVEHYLVVGT